MLFRSTQPNEPQTPSALHWLREKLAHIQSVKVLELEAAQVGYTVADLNTARLAIGGVRVVPCLGVDYWRLPSADENQKRQNQFNALKVST